MKMFLRFFFLIINIAIAPLVHAEKADSNKPTEIDAEKMAYDDVKQVSTITGAVVIVRGTLIMKSERAIVTKDPSGYQYVTLFAAPGALASFRQKRDGGPDLWVDGQAERIEYDDKTEIAKLFSKAKMRRLDGTKPTDEVEGEFISYDSRAEFMAVNNTATGESTPGGGRIKMVIQPRTPGAPK